MPISLITNANAMTALRVLASTESRLATAQNQASTGLRVSSARDDASVFAVSTTLRSEQQATEVVRGSLGRAHGVLSVAMAGATRILERLTDLKAKAIDYAGTQDAQQRQIYRDDITQILGDIDQVASTAQFDGLQPLSRTTVDFPVDSVGNASPPLPGAIVGYLDNIRLRVRAAPGNTRSEGGDVNGNGVINGGENFELDFLLDSVSGHTAQNVRYSDVKIQPAAPSTPGGASLDYNTSGVLGDVGPGGTVVSGPGADLDINTGTLADPTPLLITMTIEADGQRASILFSSMNLGSIKDGDVIPRSGTVVKFVTAGGRTPVAGETLVSAPPSDATNDKMSFIGDTQGTQLQVNYQNLSVAGLGLSGFAPEMPDGAVSQIDTAFKKVSDALASFASASRAVDARDEMLRVQADALAEGLGSMVDADMARAAAALTAEQSRQQMAMQALSIANSEPNQILTLFGNR